MSTKPFRLAEGGRVDRTSPIHFTYDGRAYAGVAGDTLAAALLANGVSVVGRSFKYHRPRGIVTAGVDEPNALVQLGAGARTEPNSRATQIELYEGLVATSQNCWPSVENDFGAVIGRLSFLFPAAFYYKTFMWPRRSWKTYEYYIRSLAGMGRAPEQPDPDRYEKMYAHCDVLVAGGGPAGTAAALAAARAGARVILVDEQSELGGSLLGSKTQIGGRPALEWVAAGAKTLANMPEVRLLTRSTVFGYYDHNYLAVAQRVTDHLGPQAAPAGAPRQRLWKIRARQVVLATGAHERPLVFADNDRPGVMLASAAQTYVNRYAVKPGRRAVVFTNNDGAYQAALDIAAAGIEVVAIVDVRRQPKGLLPAAAREAGLTLLDGHAITATQGVKRVESVDVMALDHAADRVGGENKRLGCDLVCMSSGWSPAVHLLSQSGGSLRFDAEKACFVPSGSVQSERSAGAAAGEMRLAGCLAQGFAAGAAAAAAAGFGDGEAPPAPEAPEPEHQRLAPIWEIPAPPGRKKRMCFVDFQNDVTADDIRLAVREGYLSIEHLKRYTTTGMGPDQGKSGNLNALSIFARATGVDVSKAGTTTFRPPYTPVTCGAMAGSETDGLFDPVRHTPIHAWHVAAGARLENAGQWLRPLCYPRSGEDLPATVRRECEAVGTSLGIVDVSSLGKLEVQGPDAAELLDRVYTIAWDELPIGRCRYGLMLGEDGLVFDDGVGARLGEDHYLVSTTSGGATHVHGWLEEWLQCEWRDLEVWITNVTAQYAVVTLSGPNARQLLSGACHDVDLAPEEFPFMAFREGTVAGIPARIFRVGFTGELTYEINVPASYGTALWETLMAAGEGDEITPYGTEAMHVLRAEKGFMIVGQETDGTVTPADLGMARLVSSKKPDFLGRRSLSRPDMLKAGRRQLVGLLTEDPNVVLPEGAQIVSEVRPRPPMPMEGHVASSYFGPRVGRSIALALLSDGLGRKGETVTVWAPGGITRALVADPVFYDPQGVRMRG